MQKIRGFESALPIALLRARAATAHKFKPHTDALGLSQPQWRVLRALAPGEPLDSRTIAQRCALLPPSVSRIVRSLQERGLIAPGEAPDGRTRPLVLTPAGQAIFDEVAVVSEAVYRDIEVAFGREALVALLAELRRLTEVCEGLPDLPRPETLQALKGEAK
jgi:homoprotocatechuate degradation regulator HpaR